MLKLSPIKGKKNFDKIFAEAKKFKSDNLNAFIRFRSVFPNDECIPITIFFAVSVSKKISKKAVIRNRIKRLLRESLRYAIIQPNFCESIVIIENVVLIWRKPIQSPRLIKLNDVVPELFDILRSAINHYKENVNEISKKNTFSNN